MPNACAGPGSGQYMSAIFYHNDGQRRLAEASRDREVTRLKVKQLTTPILALQKFYLAEDYHQKFYLRRDPQLAKEFKAMYPRGEDFLNSTAAARVNGYVKGHGTPEALEKEIQDFGLSPEGCRILRAAVRPRPGRQASD
jgi:peptide-methionine (S)-S-oxide reductase